MELLPDPPRGQFVLAVLPQGAFSQLMEHAARLVLRGRLRVLDGGNRFNVYLVSTILRRHTDEVEAALKRMQVVRAGTCYQVETLLAEMPATATPTLVIDLLATFGDEKVPLAERRRLLGICLVHLQRLAGGGPVLVNARGQGAPHSDTLFADLEAAAGLVWRFGPPLPPGEGRLF